MIKTTKEAEIIWQKFIQVGSQARNFKRKAQELIPALAKSKVYLNHGYASLEEAASILAGIGHETTRKILSAYRRTEGLPKLRKTMKTEGYNKIYTALAVKDKLSEEKLVEMVIDLPTKALRKKVRELNNPEEKWQQSIFDESVEVNLGSGSQKINRFSAEVESELEENLKLIKARLEKEKGHALSNQDLLEYFVQKELSENPLPHQEVEEYPKAKTNKTLSQKHKTHLKAQNRGVCQSPNCHEVATESHHTHYQSLKPRNHQDLQSLCRVHHQLAHFETENRLNNQKYTHKSQAQLRIDAKVRKYWKKT